MVVIQTINENPALICIIFVPWKEGKDAKHFIQHHIQQLVMFACLCLLKSNLKEVPVMAQSSQYACKILQLNFVFRGIRKSYHTLSKVTLSNSFK